MALTTVKSDQIQTSVALAGSPTTTTQSASDNSTKIATTAYADTAVANLVASAPASLNTLDELAAALNDDASFSTTVTNSIAAKLPLAGGTLTGALVVTGDANPALEVSRGSANTTNVNLKYNTTLTGQLSAANEKFQISAAGSGTEMEFYTNGTRALEIDTNGNVGIGPSSPSTRLHIQSPDNTLATDIFKLTSQNATAGLKFGYQRIEQVGSTSPITFNTGGTERMRIRETGALEFKGASTTANAQAFITNDNSTLTIGSSVSGSVVKDIHFNSPSTMMVIDGSSGNVGIGHTSPAYGLSIHKEGDHLQLTTNTSGEAAGNGTDLKVDASSSDFQLLNYESANITLWTASAERIRIDSSGRVGIGGASNSSWRNDLSDKVLTLGTEAALMSDSGVTTELWNNSLVNNSDQFLNISTRGASRYMQYSGAHKWFTAASASAGSNISTELNSTPKMVLEITGKLGIGNATPVAHLHVETSTNTPLYLKSTHSGGGYVEYAMGANGAVLGYMGSASQLVTGGSNTDLNVRSQNNFTIGTGGHNERLKIASNGHAEFYFDIKHNPNSAGGHRYFHVNRTSGYDGGLVFYQSMTAQWQQVTDSSHNLNFYSYQNGAGTQIKFESGGDLNVLDGNVKVASGHGIDFSATAGPSNSASSSSELFDDYEQGSWTPVLSGVGSHTLYYARYTKIGDLCYLSCYVYNLGSITGGSGDFAITGLPYTGTHANGAAGVTNCAHSTNTKSISSRIHNNAVYIVEDITSNGGNWVNCNQLQYASHVQITIVYHV